MKIAIGLAVLPLSLLSFSSQAEEDVNVTPYIVGGDLGNVADYPFMASLMFEYESQPGKVFPLCGGSVLDSTHILTAAHCVYNVASYRIASMKVAIEANDEQGMLAAPRVSVKNIYYPSNYSDSTLLNDVAVLELAQPLPNYTTIHQTILADLSVQGQEYRQLPAKTFTIVGYGSLDSDTPNEQFDFMKASVRYVDPDACNIWSNYITSDKQVCTSGSSFDNSQLVTAACQGDSGGPLIWDNNGIKTQIGIMSMVPYPCGSSLTTQSVYTDVSQYTDWINKAQNGEIEATRTATDLSDSSGGVFTFGGFFGLLMLSLYRKKSL